MNNAPGKALFKPCYFFVQAEDGIREATVTGVQTCALPLLCCSSRRRHTRCYRDWSSDVCSSDLWTRRRPSARPARRRRRLGSGQPTPRSEERRVGEEGRTRWAPDPLKKKHSDVPARLPLFPLPPAAAHSAPPPQSR